MYYSCSQKGQMNRHVVSVHEGRKPFIGKISLKFIKWGSHFWLLDGFDIHD